MKIMVASSGRVHSDYVLDRSTYHLLYASHARQVLVADKWVNTNGATVKARILTDWEKGTPWHFWEYKSRLTGVPKKSLCRKT